MPVHLPTPDQMAEVLVGMRATIAARQASAPEPVNLEAALALSEPPPLLWRGREYRVRDISYPEGLKLQRCMLRFNRLGKQEGEQTEEDLDAHEALFDETVALFWSFLDPKPPANPFTTLAPREVGALADFFFVCQKIQNLPPSSATRFPQRSTT